MTKSAPGWFSTKGKIHRKLVNGRWQSDIFLSLFWKKTLHWTQVGLLWTPGRGEWFLDAPLGHDDSLVRGMVTSMYIYMYVIHYLYLHIFTHIYIFTYIYVINEICTCIHIYIYTVYIYVYYGNSQGGLMLTDVKKYRLAPKSLRIKCGIRMIGRRRNSFQLPTTSQADVIKDDGLFYGRNPKSPNMS